MGFEAYSGNLGFALFLIFILHGCNFCSIDVRDARSTSWYHDTWAQWSWKDNLYSHSDEGFNCDRLASQVGLFHDDLMF